MKKNKLILILFCLIPVLPSAQSVKESLSPETQLLIMQASNKKNMKSTVSNFSKMFDFAITSRFSADFNIAKEFNMMDILSVVSAEFYVGSPKVKFLGTIRTIMPSLYFSHGANSFLSTSFFTDFYIGMGFGTAVGIFDNRNSQGRGLNILVNLLYTIDFELNSLDLYGFNFRQAFDFEFRFHYFLAKNFGLVFGIGSSLGVRNFEIERQIGNDGYPVNPYQSFGRIFVADVSVGATVGLVF